MSKQRTIRLDCGKSTSVMYVLGTELSIDLYTSSPPGSTSFEVRFSPGTKCSISSHGSVLSDQPKLWPIDRRTFLLVTVDIPSRDVNDKKITVTYFGKDATKPIDKMMLALTAVYISLDVDADRDGKIEKNNPNKASWSWGPDGHGAILLVNCDRDNLSASKPDNEDLAVNSFNDLKDMSRIILRTEGPESLTSGYKLHLSISASDNDKVNVFYHKHTSITSVLGPKKLSFAVDYAVGSSDYDFYVEALKFPDAGINPFVTINLNLLEPMTIGEAPIFTDRIVFRIAPWIMTPNTQAPLEVFVCRMFSDPRSPSSAGNEDFLREFQAFVQKARCKLTICPQHVNRGDRWIQDEIEFGYTEAPYKYLPVVLDSPRNRGLQDFPYQQILGIDFGHVTQNTSDVSSLDSFGNLEVSPPVTVNGKDYPFGRIIIGNAFPTTYGGRKMTKVVREFLHAQKVQSPIELYSDWLAVGHVDEFLSFVPAPDRKGFRLLLTCPDACLRLFTKLQQEGHGELKMFEGVSPNTIKINEILEDKKIVEDNAFVQECVNWNRDILKRELGLDEEDIIDIPGLFFMKSGHAKAYFPDMVNMIVLDKYLGIPKPFGPLINKKCPLESAVRSLLEPLGVTQSFGSLLMNDALTPTFL
uniref:Peptidyl arginine deiminase, type II n=1 Tax=Callorhinchus milii TaxID=7868 RepID=A0A4W3IYK3_CALMI